MRNLNKPSAIAFAALAVALVALPALASDPDPMLYSSCTSGCATVTTTGPVACGDNTCITYNVTGTAPDHLGLFLRSEAVVLSATSGGGSGSAIFNSSTACGKGDSVLGLGSNLLCHERLLRFDNRFAKAIWFKLEVKGKRKPIITTVTTRKGNAQCANPIVGIGLEEPPASGSCVNSCGNFNPKQSVIKTEIFRFGPCMLKFDREQDGSVNPLNGFSTYPAADAPENTVCTPKTGPISDILVNHVPAEQGAFGDGWLNSKDPNSPDPCATRFIGGTYMSSCW